MAWDQIWPVEVEEAAAVGGVAVEDAGEVGEVDGQRPQQRGGSGAEERLELLAELGVAGPVPLGERGDAVGGELGRALDPFSERVNQTVSDQLQRGGVALEVGAGEPDDSSTIAAVHRCAQPSSPLPACDTA